MGQPKHVGHPNGHLGAGTLSDTVENEVKGDFYRNIGVLFAG
jgi:hypothetical protein